MASRRLKANATQPANENQGALIGWRQISEYAGLCASTLIRYTRSDGFPACHLPDKRMFTTKGLVDQWVMARMVIEQESTEKRDYSETGENGLE